MPYPAGNSRRSLMCGSIVLVASSLLILVFLNISLYTPLRHARLLAALPYQATDFDGSNKLGNAFRIYVVSLPRRTDRRAEMDRLREALSLNWTYADAVDATDPEITAILERVHLTRKHIASMIKSDRDNTLKQEVVYEPHQKIDRDGNIVNVSVPAFLWPQDIDELARASHPLSPSGAELWSQTSTSPPTLIGTSDLYPYIPPVALHEIEQLPPQPLACTRRNNLFATFSSHLPSYKRLTQGKAACWHSHLRVIQDVANSEDKRPALVLEDDVDMERDIRARLDALWVGLPNEWDVVYLGHCWSNETEHPPLHVVSSSLFIPSDGPVEHRYNSSALHPSAGPKCTHAYVLSRTGARRILLHLRHPPFAYSRAIDQALAWLVKSERLRAFSIVPPIVVQRKVGKSDLMEGKGSIWKDRLYYGVLDLGGRGG